MADLHIKICGIRNKDEAHYLISKKINFIGLNFIPSSKRLVDLHTASSIMNIIKKSNVKSVLLFKDHDRAAIIEIVKALKPDYIQLNGSETNSFAESLKLPVIRTIGIDTSDNIQRILENIKPHATQNIILDRVKQGAGPRVDIELAKTVVLKQSKNIFIAGGLDSTNIKQLIENVRPYGIDIAGGVRTNNDLDEKKVSALLNVITSIRLPNHL